MIHFTINFPLLDKGRGDEPIVRVFVRHENPAASCLYIQGELSLIQFDFPRCDFALAFVNELYRQMVCFSPVNHYALLDLMARLEADGQAYFPPPFIYLEPAAKGVDTPPAGDQE